MIFKDDIVIELIIFGDTLKVYKIKNNKIMNEFSFNLIDYDFKYSGLFTYLMKSWSDYKLLVSWNDLRFLRKIGIRI